MSELYQLPDGWEWKKLGDVSKIIGGGTPKTNVKEYWENGTIVWLAPTDLGDIGEICHVSNSKKKLTKLGLDNSSAKLLPIGTVLYSSRATIGKIAINTVEVSTNQGFANFICDKNLLNKYLAFCLNRFTSDIASLSNSTTFKEVSKSNLKELKIPLPPLPEQQRIVSKLDALFEKIDKATALHVKNMEEADAFMGSVLNDVFGELEEKYGLIEVGTVTECIVPQRNKPKQFIGDIQWITTDDLQLFKKISKSSKGMGLTREDIEDVKSKIIPKNSVLMSCVGDLGIVAIADDEIVVNQQLHTYQCKDNLLNTYLMYALYVKKAYMYQIANITTVAYMNKSKCNSIPIPLPPLPIQQKTVTYLDEISQKIEKIKQLQKEKLSSLKALKASILDQAFRGAL